jgi:hypothetical protein
MMRSERKPLSGLVDIDDSFWGSARVVVGLSIPKGRCKYGKDSAISASAMPTAIIDSMGYVIFLDLARMFLIDSDFEQSLH